MITKKSISTTVNAAFSIWQYILRVVNLIHFDICFRLQDRLKESITVIQKLERENSTFKQDKLKLIAELDTIKLEKERLQAILSQENDDKKKLADKFNTFTVIGELERCLSNSKEY